jgi:hypothetical protein
LTAAGYRPREKAIDIYIECDRPSRTHAKNILIRQRDHHQGSCLHPYGLGIQYGRNGEDQEKYGCCAYGTQKPFFGFTRRLP